MGAQAGNPENHAIRNAEHAHEGMHHDAKRQKDGGEDGAAIQNRKNRPDNERGGDRAWMQVLVDNVEGGARDGKGKEGADQRDGSPLSGCCRKAALGQPEASPQQEKRGQALAEQFDSRYGNVGSANENCNQSVKNAGLHLQGEQPEIMGIERRVQAPLDCGKVYGVIFDAGVVTF